MVIPKCTSKHLKCDDHIFPKYAQDYLKTKIEELKHREIDTMEEMKKARSALQKKNAFSNKDEIGLKLHIDRINKRDIKKHERTLSSLCESSKWKHIGRQSMVHNLSDRKISSTESEALSLGLKFAINTNNNNITDTITNNYGYSDTDFEKGFIQGIITASINSTDEYNTIPLRYKTALDLLAKDKTIYITNSDKSGGAVIMNKRDYVDKITTMLEDDTTYEQTDKSTVEKETAKFNRSLKKTLKNYGKTWTQLIDYHPLIPQLHGLPKLHKQNIPIRPIISGIGSAPHKIARALAKILTPLLGTISPSHLKNSGDLINKLQNIDTRNKKLASLDVTSLYTNIPVHKCLDRLQKYLKKSKIKLSLPTSKIIRLCELITDQCFFEFDKKIYKQTFGLPMGSPLSAPLACIYLEFLEIDQLYKILPPDTHYYRYIDDALILHPDHIDLDNLVTKMNEVEETITFTYEVESNNTLSYLDINLHRTENSLERSVHRKKTNNNDLINFYSSHSTEIKSSIMIGFFLRALRICTPNYLSEEENYIEKTFKSLHYPHHFIRRARRKAHKIYSKPKCPDTENKRIRRIVLPTNNISTQLSKNLTHHNIQVVTKTPCTIRKLVSTSSNHTPASEACIYHIKCQKCEKVYFGETSRDIKTRIREHKRDLINDNTLNALVQHRNEHDHNFDLKNAHVVKFIHNIKTRRCLESSLISHFETIQQRPGFYQIAPNLAKQILKQHNLLYLKHTNKKSQPD